jgi:hypothetical protein
MSSLPDDDLESHRRHGGRAWQIVEACLSPELDGMPYNRDNYIGPNRERRIKSLLARLSPGGRTRWSRGLSR